MNDANGILDSSRLIAQGGFGATSLDVNLRHYLRRSGWEKQSPGPSGSLWHRTSGPGARAVLAVPEPIDADTSEWAGIIRRLAAVERRPAVDIAVSILTQYVDITRFRAARLRAIILTLATK
jgi:hypothetical protein